VSDSNFSELLDASGVPFAIVANVLTGESVRFGNSSEVRFEDLAKSLFGDADAIVATNASLEGQILPRIWGQGTLSVAVCKPTDKTIVGAFSDTKMGIKDQYLWSKKLDAKFADFFSHDRNESISQR
jgi:hypothetical protein